LRVSSDPPTGFWWVWTTAGGGRFCTRRAGKGFGEFLSGRPGLPRFRTKKAGFSPPHHRFRKGFLRRGGGGTQGPGLRGKRGVGGQKTFGAGHVFPFLPHVFPGRPSGGGPGGRQDPPPIPASAISGGPGRGVRPSFPFFFRGSRGTGSQGKFGSGGGPRAGEGGPGAPPTPPPFCGPGTRGLVTGPPAPRPNPLQGMIFPQRKGGGGALPGGPLGPPRFSGPGVLALPAWVSPPPGDFHVRRSNTPGGGTKIFSLLALKGWGEREPPPPLRGPRNLREGGGANPALTGKNWGLGPNRFLPQPARELYFFIPGAINHLPGQRRGAGAHPPAPAFDLSGLRFWNWVRTIPPGGVGGGGGGPLRKTKTQTFCPGGPPRHLVGPPRPRLRGSKNRAPSQAFFSGPGRSTVAAFFSVAADRRPRGGGAGGPLLYFGGGGGGSFPHSCFRGREGGLRGGKGGTAPAQKKTLFEGEGSRRMFYASYDTEGGSWGNVRGRGTPLA